jgi:hypothetical protein
VECKSKCDTTNNRDNWKHFKFIPKLSEQHTYWQVQGVPLANEPGISLIILPLKRILQRNLTHTTDTHYRHALQTHYRHVLQTHYRHTLQTRTTDTHYRHTLQTHSSPSLTQRTNSCSNFVAISSLVLE